jgi:hypothetical protein
MRTCRTQGQWKPTVIRALLYVCVLRGLGPRGWPIRALLYVCVVLRGLGPRGWPIPRPRSRTKYLEGLA